MTIEEQRACMAPLQMAGTLIMENGGETYRVEETVTRIGRAFGLAEVESFAVPSGLFISYRMADGSVETAVKRVHRGDVNLTRVNRVNSISRRVEREGMTPAQTLAELEEVAGSGLRAALLPLGAGICAAGFTWMFEGNAEAFLISFLVSALVYLGMRLFERAGMDAMGSVVLGSFVTVLAPRLLGLAIAGLQTEAIIGGALMPMLPGLTMTTAVQDLMRGDMISGLSHGAKALLTAALVAGGALAANALFGLIAGGKI